MADNDAEQSSGSTAPLFKKRSSRPNISRPVRSSLIADEDEPSKSQLADRGQEEEDAR
jgi:hypothetical protein